MIFLNGCYCFVRFQDSLAICFLPKHNPVLNARFIPQNALQLEVDKTYDSKNHANGKTYRQKLTKHLVDVEENAVDVAIWRERLTEKKERAQQ